MDDFVIMTDSACDMPAKLADDLGIIVQPLHVTIEGKDYPFYLDERELGTKEFYSKMRSGITASTSAANVEAFFTLMTPVLEKGIDIIYMAFSSALSSTYSAAVTAAAELKELFPERKVYVVDTLCASMGQGLIVYLTAMEKKRGGTIDEVYQYAENTKGKLCHWFTVDDLHHLKRGGRVSAATAIVGTVLNIKPVLHVDDMGRLINVGKARGRKASIKALVDHMESTAIEPAGQTVFISHGDCLDEAELMANMVRERMGVKDIIISCIGPVVGAHSGPGTLALFFLGTER